MYFDFAGFEKNNLNEKKNHAPERGIEPATAHISQNHS